MVIGAGRYLSQSGYVSIKTDAGWKLEHRVVWQHHNGPIPDGGVIHHVSGDRADNRIENLEMLPNGDHVAAHAGHVSRVIDGQLMKRCSVCDDWLPAEMFNKNKSNGLRSGLNSMCRGCTRARYHGAVRSCERCGKQFDTWKGHTPRFCSGTCAKLDEWDHNPRRERFSATVTCLQCGVEKVISAKHKNVRFCSRSCAKKHDWLHNPNRAKQKALALL